MAGRDRTPGDAKPTVSEMSFELSRYIDSLTVATNRTRYVLIIAVIVSLLLVVAYRNAHPRGWYQTREDLVGLVLKHRLWDPHRDWQGLVAEVEQRNPDISEDEIRHLQDLIKIAKVWAEQRHFRTEADLKDWLNRLRDEEIEDIIFVTVPILGLTFDVNDLGAVGGISLTILMLILLFSISREHESLCLCLFKVRRLDEANPQPSEGESPANFLYHALATMQVFGRPPTLAHWESRRWPSIVKVAYLVPLLPQALILTQDWRGQHIAMILNADAVRWTFYIEIASILILALLGVAICLLSRSMDIRWRETFYRINPDYRVKGPQKLTDWIRLQPRPDEPQPRTALDDE